MMNGQVTRERRRSSRITQQYCRAFSEGILLTLPNELLLLIIYNLFDARDLCTETFYRSNLCRLAATCRRLRLLALPELYVFVDLILQHRNCENCAHFHNSTIEIRQEQKRFRAFCTMLHYYGMDVYCKNLALLLKYDDNATLGFSILSKYSSGLKHIRRLVLCYNPAGSTRRIAYDDHSEANWVKTFSSLAGLSDLLLTGMTHFKDVVLALSSHGKKYPNQMTNLGVEFLRYSLHSHHAAEVGNISIPPVSGLDALEILYIMGGAAYGSFPFSFQCGGMPPEAITALFSSCKLRKIVMTLWPCQPYKDCPNVSAVNTLLELQGDYVRHLQMTGTPCVQGFVWCPPDSFPSLTHLSITGHAFGKINGPATLKKIVHAVSNSPLEFLALDDCIRLPRPTLINILKVESGNWIDSLKCISLKKQSAEARTNGDERGLGRDEIERFKGDADHLLWLWFPGEREELEQVLMKRNTNMASNFHLIDSGYLRVRIV